jgi:hypothetical protein
MSKNTPWEDIQTPNKDFNVRKISGTCGLPLYWGKDNTGHCLFILELNGDHTENFRQNFISVHGIKIDLRLIESSKSQGLVIALEKHVDQDLFFSLCETLIGALQQTSDSKVALSVAFSQIKRWKAFLAGRKTKLLTSEEVRGLFGELTFIQYLLHKGFSERYSIESWQGPEDSHQDFIFGNAAVEIKCLSGRERSTVRVSSEDQLESLSDNLFLKIFRIIEMPSPEKAKSLNQLVKEIENGFTDAESLEAFSHKIAKAGYVELREYDNPKFMIIAEKTYHVTEDFPCLIRSALPKGIVRVGYEIELEFLKSFECSSKDIWGE